MSGSYTLQQKSCCGGGSQTSNGPGAMRKVENIFHQQSSEYRGIHEVIEERTRRNLSYMPHGDYLEVGKYHRFRHPDLI